MHDLLAFIRDSQLRYDCTRTRSAGQPAAPGRQIRLVVGITFEDNDLTERGIFVDADGVEEHLDQEVARLESAPWTQIFSFRPSMELVSRDSFHRLQPRIDNLAYVEFDDVQLGVLTRYSPSPEAASLSPEWAPQRSPDAVPRRVQTGMNSAP